MIMEMYVYAEKMEILLFGTYYFFLAQSCAIIVRVAMDMTHGFSPSGPV